MDSSSSGRTRSTRCSIASRAFRSSLVRPADSRSARIAVAKEVADFAATLPPEEQRRIRFYYRRDVDINEAFRAWDEADIPQQFATEVDDWREMHAIFGGEFALQVAEDVRSHPERFGG